MEYGKLGNTDIEVSKLYPLSRVRGVIPANHIFKDKDNVVLKK